MTAILFCSWAQAQKDSLVKSLDEVVLTANKYPVKQSQTGKVITVISRSQLEKSTGKTLGQVLNEQAGLNIAGALNNLGTNQSIFLRGAASGRTLITIDGVPVSDPSLINNEFDINLLAIGNIEEIEICKGSQSTLYGSDAVAGVINIITTKTDISKPVNMKATAVAGNRGYLNGNAQVYGKLANQLTYNVRYAKLYTNGFSSAWDSSGKKKFDNDGYNGDVATANLTWNATRELTLKSFTQYSGYVNEIDNSAFSDDRDYSFRSKTLMAGGGFVYKLPAATVTGNYLYNQGNRTFLNDSSDNFKAYLDDSYKAQTQFVELYGSFNLGKGFTLLQGADHRAAFMSKKLLSIFPPYPDYVDPLAEKKASQTSIYSSLFYTSNWGLNAELGGRLNTHSAYGSNYTYTFNPSYVIAQKVKLLASVSTGFKAPTLYQLYSRYGTDSLKPEKSLHYEAGAQFTNHMVNTRLVYFNRETDDALDYNYTKNKYFNISHQEAYGLEFENKLQLGKRVSVNANYTWLKVKEQSQHRITYKDTAYRYGLRRPEHTANITLGFQPADQFFVSLSAHYESKRMDLGGYMAKDVSLDPFCILNAYAEYKPVSYLKVFADAKNLTDKKFFTVYGYNSIPFLVSGGISISL
ncbi:TonB-dependent receptor [Paraflavisolibacter sp. H34]|uniref:TonB-dependent receptor plug domain-containing protein n=1 Tax=Huijunlia imazamoxiresistens TaxID=3127457 RepID=UPI0030184DE0